MVLAAGSGTRLAPLTDQLPKALVPVGAVPLLTSALDRVADVVGEGPGHLAVNAHAHAELVAQAAAGRAHVSREDLLPAGEALGTAGALGALRGWLEGRAVLLTNADAWMPEGPAVLRELARGWDGERCRLLCEPAALGSRADFRTPAGHPAGEGVGVRYLGSCLLPAAAVAGLPQTPSGLYEVLWRDLLGDGGTPCGGLELAVVEAPAGRCTALDCGSPADYLRANLAATGGASAVSPGAVVHGRVERCVVWPGAVVTEDERLVEVVRAGTAERPLTVDAAPRRGGPNLHG